MKLTIAWKRKTGHYTNGTTAYLNKIAVGSVNWDTVSSNRELRYKVTCTLPQANRADTNFETQEQGKAKLQSIIESWFNEALSNPTIEE